MPRNAIKGDAGRFFGKSAEVFLTGNYQRLRGQIYGNFSGCARGRSGLEAGNLPKEDFFFAEEDAMIDYQ